MLSFFGKEYSEELYRNISLIHVKETPEQDITDNIYKCYCNTIFRSKYFFRGSATHIGCCDRCMECLGKQTVLRYLHLTFTLKITSVLGAGKRFFSPAIMQVFFLMLMSCQVFIKYILNMEKRQVMITTKKSWGMLVCVWKAYSTENSSPIHLDC